MRPANEQKNTNKDERIHCLMLTAKPANVRPHSTVSLSMLLASLTCRRHDKIPKHLRSEGRKIYKKKKEVKTASDCEL